MKFQEFERLPAAKRRVPLLIIHGPEEYFRQEALALIHRAASLENDTVGFVEFHGPANERALGELPLAKVLDEVRTISLFGEGKLVVVRSADAFLVAHGESIAAYGAAPARSAILALEAETWDRRRKAARKLEKVALTVECPRLFDRPPPWKRHLPPEDTDLARFAHERCRLAGLAAGPREAHFLTTLTGNNLFDIQHAVERLALVVGPGRPVAVEDIERVVGRTRRDDIFAFIDALGQRDTRAALEVLQTIFEAGIEASGRRVLDPGVIFGRAFAAVHRKLRDIRRATAFFGAGGARRDAPQVLGIKPFLVDRLLEEVRAYRGVDLDGLWGALVEADRDVKTNRAGAWRSLETLVLRICQGASRN